MASGAVWVTPRKDPANISVAPNSPSARPQASAMPATRPGIAAGMATRANVRASDAPSVREASIQDRSTAAMPGLVAGMALAWGRALGEFGATLMFAGSFRGVTQTAPLAIYDRFATDFPGALALAAVLVAVSAALLAAVKLVSGPAGARAAP